MRTLIVSDLHLGTGGEYDAFAGAEALPALLDRFSTSPTRVLVNGDGIDFLMNDDPLELDPVRAVAQARTIAAAPGSAGVLAAFGRVLAAGGEVIVRLGNHDVELALPDVQSALRGALGQPAEVAARLRFQLGDTPEILEVGGARLLITHGEQNDKWNKVDYKKLLSVDGFKYAAGSLLVKKFLNPLTRDHGLRFANLLKPDFQGALLTALAVAPSAVKLLFQDASFSVLYQLFGKASLITFKNPQGETEEEPDLGLLDRMGDLGLDPAEQDALEGIMGDGPAAFADGDEDGMVSRAKIKLARGALKLYAGAQRRLSGTAGDTYFALEPVAEEWKEAERLAKKFETGAVIIGHTHAARWKQAEGLTFANTGTWISLMQLPAFDAGDEAWAEFIAELRTNPRLDPAKQKVAKTMSRFTASIVDAHPEGGAALSLVQWDGAELAPLGTTRISPAR